MFETGRRRQTPDVVGWGGDDVADDDDTACLLSNDELRQEQRRVIREQDEGDIRLLGRVERAEFGPFCFIASVPLLPVG